MSGSAAGWVDAHHHFWDPRRRDHPWLAKPALAALRRRFGPTDLVEAISGSGIGATIVVQAADDAGETADLLAQADGRPVAGVVGWVDLPHQGATTYLEEWRDTPAGDRLVGVRANLRGPLGWAPTDSTAASSLRRLAALDLTLDVLASPGSLPVVEAVAAAHPSLRVVVDHAGQPPSGGDRRPGRASSPDLEWATAIRRVARRDNVAVKFSGLVTRAPGVRRDAAELRQIAETLLDAFGDDRVLFGSDWPVCLLTASHGTVLAIARAVMAGADPDRVFGGNARAWYRLVT